MQMSFRTYPLSQFRIGQHRLTRWNAIRSCAVHSRAVKPICAAIATIWTQRFMPLQREQILTRTWTDRILTFPVEMKGT